MQDTNRQSAPADDEINLIDLWRVIAKRKVLVLAMPVLLLLVAVMYLLITPAIFESRAVIQVGQVAPIGQVGPVGQIEAPAALVQRLKEKYRVDDKDPVPEMPRVTEISLNKKGPSNAVTFLVQDHSAEGAQKHLTQVMQALLAEHTTLYNQAMNAQRQRLQSLNKQMHALNDYSETLSAHVEAVRKQDPAQAAILAIEKGKLLTDAPRLESEYTALQLAMSDIQSQPTKLLREPTLPNSQIKPKSKLVLVIALVLGFMLGLIAAFFAEFLAKVRQQLRERAV